MSDTTTKTEYGTVRMDLWANEGQENITEQVGGCNRNQATFVELQAEEQQLYIPRPDRDLLRTRS